MSKMVEMTSFSPEDTSAIRRNIEREAYALLRGFFDAEDLRDAVAAFERVLSSHGWTDGSREPGQAYIKPGVFHLHSSKEFYDLQYDFYLEQAIHKAVHHEKLRSFFRTYFDEEAILHPNFYPRAVFTAPPSLAYYPTPKHQDFPVFQGSPKTITCWLVFNNCPRENGPLIVSPSSHTRVIPTLKALTKHASNEAVAARAKRLLGQLVTVSEAPDGADRSRLYAPH